MRTYSGKKSFVSLLALSFCMMLVTNCFSSLDGMYRGAAFASHRSSQKRVGVKRQQVPQEWNWFQEELDVFKTDKAKSAKTRTAKRPIRKTIGAPVPTSGATVEFSSADSSIPTMREVEVESQRANPSFQLAYAKMMSIKSKRTEKDKEILASLKKQQKTSSMHIMNKKIKEIRSRDRNYRKTDRVSEPVKNHKKVTAPKYTTKHKRAQKKQAKIKETEILEKASAIASTVSTVAIPSVTSAPSSSHRTVPAPPRDEPRFVQSNVPALDLDEFIKEEADMSFVVPQMDLNEIIAIDDVVAIDTAPPVIVTPRKETVTTATYQKSDSNSRRVKGYNRYAPAKPVKIETLYRGVNGVYSPRINELVNERKDKIFADR